MLLELDKYFGEIESSIIQEEIQTMTKLSEFIIQHWISDLHLILKLIAELDWYVLYKYLNAFIISLHFNNISTEI